MAVQDSEAAEILYPERQSEYEAALLDVDRENLKDQIKAAEEAIERRLQQLSQDSNHYAERRVIHDALISLRLLNVFSQSDQPDMPQ
jgi:hypothetical protein